MSILSAPRFTVLSDHVTGDNESENTFVADPFAFQIRLAPIFDILRHKDTDTPLAVALYGDAGTGKTVALRWLVQQTDSWNGMSAQDRDGHPRVLPIWFSARKYDSTDCILREVVSEIILQYLDQALFIDPQETLKRLSAAIEICGPVLGPGFVLRVESIARRGNILDGLRPVAASVGFAPVRIESCIGMCCDLLVQWLSAEQRGETPPRIAMFIDDLDHCRQDVMMSAFNAISLHLNVPGIIFVAGLSCAETMNLITRHYKELGYGEVQSRHYLSRMFQVEYHIEPSNEQVRQFYDEQVALLDSRTGQMLQTHLTAEFKHYIDTAVLHLSGGNPRKIKLLLNSALMKGWGASQYCPVPGGQDAAAHLRFAQGVQIYLLQRWLSYFSEGASVLYRPDVLDWFTALSRDAGTPGSDYKRAAAPELNNAVSFSSRPVRADTNRKSALQAPPEGLSSSMIHEWVWNLLKIPFSRNVVISYTQSESPSVKAPVEKEKGILGGASRMLKNALASALEKSVDELTDADLSKVTSLDVSGQNPSESDFAVIAGLENLERLELYNTAVQDLKEIGKLHKLKILNLSCTPVQDITPLGSLSQLNTLDLSCSGVKDVAPLAKHPELETLILFGTPIQVLDPLKGLEKLAKINLSRTAVTNDSLAVLETLPSLKSVFLRETAISRERILELKKNTKFGLHIDC